MRSGSKTIPCSYVKCMSSVWQVELAASNYVSQDVKWCVFHRSFETFQGKCSKVLIIAVPNDASSFSFLMLQSDDMELQPIANLVHVGV